MFFLFVCFLVFFFRGINVRLQSVKASIEALCVRVT